MRTGVGMKLQRCYKRRSPQPARRARTVAAAGRHTVAAAAPGGRGGDRVTEVRQPPAAVICLP